MGCSLFTTRSNSTTYPTRVLDSLSIGKFAAFVVKLVKSLHFSSLLFGLPHTAIDFAMNLINSLGMRSKAQYCQCIVNFVLLQLFTRTETGMGSLNFAFDEGGSQEVGSLNLSLFVILLFACLVMILLNGKPLIYL